MNVPVIFRTNIDCCKKFIRKLSGVSICDVSPCIGDSILVYHDTEFKLYMKVTQRTWENINGTKFSLVCYLDLDLPWQSIPALEKVLKELGLLSKWR